MTNLQDLWRIRGASVDVSGSGDNVILPAQPDRIYVLLGFLLSVDGDIDFTWKGQHDVGPYAVASGDGGAMDSSLGIVQTNPGQALVLNLSAAVRVTGSVRYVQFYRPAPGQVRFEDPEI